MSMALKVLSFSPPLVPVWFTFQSFSSLIRLPCFFKSVFVSSAPHFYLCSLAHGDKVQGAAGSALWSCQGSLDKVHLRWAWDGSRCVGRVPAISTAHWHSLPQREYVPGSRWERLRRLSRLTVPDYLRTCGLSPHRIQRD